MEKINYPKIEPVEKTTTISGTTTELTTITTVPKTTTINIDDYKEEYWHGEEDVASWEFQGGFNDWHGDYYSRFDYEYDERHMFHSSQAVHKSKIALNLLAR